MLLSEQVRMARDEEVLDSGATDWFTNGGWTTKKTVNFTLDDTKIVYVWMKTEVSGGWGNARALLNDVPLVSVGYFESSGVEREVFLVLPAGSYTVKYQLGGNAGSGYIRLGDTKIATLNFPDKQRNSWATNPVSIPTETESTILDEDFTAPATRRLAVGTIKKYVAIITVVASCSGYAIDRMANIGETVYTQWINWRLYFDDAQVNWTERNNDKLDNDHSAYGAYGRYIVPVDPDSQHNIKLKAYHASGSNKTVFVNVGVMLCPWFLAANYYEPVSLDFPQGSTLYVTLEPLGQNPTKYAGVGKVRFRSFGEATDYYKTVSGTGILNLDYTFETVEVVNSILHVKGFGGCISAIGVDIR